MDEWWLDGLFLYLKTLRKPALSSHSSQSHKLDSETSKHSDLVTTGNKRANLIFFPWIYKVLEPLLTGALKSFSIKKGPWDQ